MCHDNEVYSPAGCAYALVFNKSAGLARADPIIPLKPAAPNFCHNFYCYPYSAPSILLIGSYNPSLKVE